MCQFYNENQETRWSVYKKDVRTHIIPRWDNQTQEKSLHKGGFQGSLMGFEPISSLDGTTRHKKKASMKEAFRGA
jgi:hypothetical protein